MAKGRKGKKAKSSARKVVQPCQQSGVYTGNKAIVKTAKAMKAKLKEKTCAR